MVYGKPKKKASLVYPSLQKTPSRNVNTEEKNLFGYFLLFTIVLERVQMSAEAQASVSYHV